MTQIDLELLVVLCHPPECWDYMTCAIIPSSSYELGLVGAAAAGGGGGSE